MGYKAQIFQRTVDSEAWTMLMDPQPTIIWSHLLPPRKHVTWEMTIQEDVDKDEEGAVLVELVTCKQKQSQLAGVFFQIIIR